MIGIAIITIIQAKLTALTTQWGAHRQEVRKRLLESLGYLRKMGVAPELQFKVRDYVENSLAQDTSMAMSPVVLNLNLSAF